MIYKKMKGLFWFCDAVAGEKKLMTCKDQKETNQAVLLFQKKTKIVKTMIRSALLTSNGRLFGLFRALFFRAFDTRNIENRHRANMLFEELSTNAMRSGVTDRDLCTWLHDVLNLVHYSRDDVPPPNAENAGRADSRAQEVALMLHSLVCCKDRDFWASATYLDVGCSMGSITGAMVRHFAPHRAYAVDLLAPERVNTSGVSTGAAEPPLFSYSQIQDESDPVIDLPTGSVHFCTCFMSLHHVRALDKVLSQLARVVQNGGYLLIREHDIAQDRDPDGKVFLDIMHAMYETVWALRGQQENAEHFDTYYAHFRSKEQWTELLAAYGFRRVLFAGDGERRFYRMSEVRRDYTKPYCKNLPHAYYALYQRDE